MICMLHGWGSTAAVWSDLRTQLADIETQALDVMPGEGTIDIWVDQIVQQMPARSVLLGWSLGAMLALRIAALYPERVSRLILIAATPCFVQQEDWPHALDAATLQAFRDSFNNSPARTLERFTALQVLGDAERNTVAARLRETLADPDDQRSALAQGLRLLAETDLRNGLPDAGLRCLFIHGDHDALMPVAAQEWLAQRWGRSEQCVLPDTGHAPHLSQPAFVAQRIRNFIADAA